MRSFITPIAHQIVVLYRKTLSEHTATALILVKPARLADTPEELRRQYHLRRLPITPPNLQNNALKPDRIELHANFKVAAKMRLKLFPRIKSLNRDGSEPMKTRLLNSM